MDVEVDEDEALNNEETQLPAVLAETLVEALGPSNNNSNCWLPTLAAVDDWMLIGGVVLYIVV